MDDAMYSTEKMGSRAVLISTNQQWSLHSLVKSHSGTWQPELDPDMTEVFLWQCFDHQMCFLKPVSCSEQGIT